MRIRVFYKNLDNESGKVFRFNQHRRYDDIDNRDRDNNLIIEDIEYLIFMISKKLGVDTNHQISTFKLYLDGNVQITQLSDIDYDDKIVLVPQEVVKIEDDNNEVIKIEDEEEKDTTTIQNDLHGFIKAEDNAVNNFPTTIVKTPGAGASAITPEDTRTTKNNNESSDTIETAKSDNQDYDERIVIDLTNNLQSKKRPAVIFGPNHNGSDREAHERHKRRKEKNNNTEETKLDTPGNNTEEPLNHAKNRNMKEDDEREESASFTREAFFSENIIHVNSYINASKKINEGFGPFIHTGIATPGFDIVPQNVAEMVAKGNATYDELRKSLVETESWCDIEDKKVREKGATQVAQWLTNAKPGCFILMRHEYPKCPHTPPALKNPSNGRYIGKVYAIGQVSKLIIPRSEEETRIKRYMDQKYFGGEGYNTHTFSSVNWKWMGYKEHLKPSTRAYINKICQPTIAKICDVGRSWPDLNTDWKNVREDLWQNALLPIHRNQFF